MAHKTNRIPLIPFKGNNSKKRTKTALKRKAKKVLSGTNRVYLRKAYGCEECGHVFARETLRSNRCPKCKDVYCVRSLGSIY